MDADLSHNPKFIPEMLEEIRSADVVLGSRFVADGKDSERKLFRRLVSKAANGYIRLLLGTKISDCNSGFRCFRRSALLAIQPNALFSRDADIVQEVLYKLIVKNQRIKEIPIAFEERKYGKTTKTMKDYFKGIVIVAKLRVLHMQGKF